MGVAVGTDSGSVSPLLLARQTLVVSALSPLSNWRQAAVSGSSLKGRHFVSGSIDSETKVLVVEDEMVLRMRAVEIVEDAGFTAIEAINADEALTILESRSDISLLFSDVQMPGRAFHQNHSRVRSDRGARCGQAG
jgi:PleD family two-component response regulator